MERAVMWEAMGTAGLEHCRLVDDGNDILADGLIIAVSGDSPFRLRYMLRCNQSWRLQETTLMILEGPVLQLRTDGLGHWTTQQGESLAELDGCLDVDITHTPFTNTLPIRRLELTPGQSAEILVAYFSAPSLQVRPARQRYTCLERSAEGARYRYESLGSGFTAELPVDSDGLVYDYPGIWRRVWPTEEPAAS